jgi:hypothetical protein
MKHNFSVSFLLSFLLRDIIFALGLVSTFVALFVPFNKLYEIIFDVYLSVADDLQSLQSFSLTTLVFSAVLCLALCIIALIHLFCDSMRAASSESKQMGAEIESGVNATKDSAEAKADTESNVAAYIFVNEMSFCLMMVNIVKVVIRRHELLLPALGLSNSLNSACSFMSLCDVLLVYVGFVRYAKHISDKKRLPWYVCPILILIGLNNAVFMPHELVSHVGSSTSLMDLFFELVAVLVPHHAPLNSCINR